MLIDETINKANALVIDSNPTARSLLTAQLRDLGVGNVRAVTRIKDARIVLENMPYDIVICDYHFEGHEESGQDLLDELRRENLLPHSTVFMMITAEATYAKVAEAAEAALDAYLIKPYTALALAERLRISRRRKRVLRDTFDAIEAQDFNLATELYLARFRSRGEFWLYAARIGAELLLRQRRTEEARELYEAIIAAKAVPWAKLGVARVDLETGDLPSARRTLEGLIGESPDNADSHDLLGRCHMEQGDITAALETYRTAAGLTPGCILRTQRTGTLAFYKGHRDEALQLLERATINGLKSKLYDAFSLVLCALIRYDQQDAKGLKRTEDQLLRMLSRHPGVERLERFKRFIEGLIYLQGKRTAVALNIARDLAKEISGDDADHESASLVIALWKRMSDSAIQLEEMDGLFTAIGMRFCTNKAATEVLVAMCENNEAAAAIMRDCHAKIFDIAANAMKQSLRGQAEVGVRFLMQEGERTRNTKLIELAMSVLKRHADKIEHAPDLERAVSGLQSRYVKPHGGGPLRTRATGGLVLRGAAAT